MAIALAPVAYASGSDCYNTPMTTRPSNSVFWFFILAAGLFVASRSLFPQSSGCLCLTGRCPVPTATASQTDDASEQVALKP